jgi:hypothetical protein
MALNLNSEKFKKEKMIPYRDLVDKLKKDFSKDRMYQIDNFSISINSEKNMANFGSNNLHVFDAYKQILIYTKSNDFYKDETQGFEMVIEFRIGSVMANITIVCKKSNSKIRVKIVNFKIGLMNIPLDLEKDIVIKDKKVKILKLNKIRSIKRFKRFFYYIVFKIYNIVNKVKED